VKSLIVVGLTLVPVLLWAAAPSAAGAQQSPGPWRPPALGEHGAVTAEHPLAAQTGLDILRAGGNAVDAAVAMAGVMAVVRPHMNGLGGDAFLLVYSAKDGKVYGLNGSGRAGSRANAATLRARRLSRMPVSGIESVTVPGAVSAWQAALQRFGSRPLSALLDPAVRLAFGGFPVSSVLREDLHGAEALIRRDPGLAAVFLPGGQLPRVGDLLVQQQLGSSLRAVAASGGEALYRGELAVALAAYFSAQGGYVTAEDLAAQHAEWVEPISTSWRGLEVVALPPNTQGVALLEMLNLLETFDLERIGTGSVDYWHILIEAKKLAFADRDAHVAEPSTYDAPLDSLLSKTYALRRAQHINLERAAAEVAPGQPRGLDDDTVVCTATDIQGNMVVLIQSLFNTFGSGLMAGDTGIVLQNRGALFSLEAGHPNELKAGHRPYHTLCPTILLQEGRPVLGLATPGGDGQVQTIVQVLDRWQMFGYDIQSAVEAPRFRSYDGLEVRLEEGAGLEVINGLEKRGHQLRLIPTGRNADFGGAQGIVVLRRAGGAAVYLAGADPRREAVALAW
jgi:gamma-glutamyltranspeptidase/glutathione hydrolase